MKKNFYLPVAILFASFVLFSCSSSDDEQNGNGSGLLNLPYSDLSVPDQKKKLAAEGESTIQKMQDLPNEASLKLLDSFSGIAADLFTVLGEKNLRSNEVQPGKPISDYFGLQSVGQLANYYGAYEWNLITRQWEKTNKDVGEKLIAVFPAQKDQATNNGRMEIVASSSITIEGKEIPTNMVAELYVNDKKEGEILLTSTGVNESSFFDTANLSVSLGSTYKLVADANKTGGKNVVKMDFTKGSFSILSAQADLEAVITREMLDEEIYSSIKDANIQITIADNIAAVGYIDGKNFIAEMNKIEAEEDKIYEDYSQWKGKLGERENALLELERRRIAAMNTYTNLALVSISEEYKVAKISFELDVEETTRTDYVDWPNGEYKYTAYNTSEVIILNFNDETQVEAEVFFGAGFDKLMKVWEDFIARFN